jgi:L-asparaginase
VIEQSDQARTPAVKLLTTGGTIATRIDAATGRSRPTLGPDDLAQLLPLGGTAMHVRELNLIPSWALTLDEMATIAAEVQQETQDPGNLGVVVTVGTSALEYLAYALDLFVQTTIPVVVTGAMRKADDLEPDGPGNLRDAVRVAASPDARGYGVLVCFARRLLSARGVYKIHREADDAFIDTAGDLGQVVDSRVSLARPPTTHRKLAGLIDTSVELVKAYPGARAHILDDARKRGARGVVIEGTPGAGGIPPSMGAALRRLVEGGTLVAVASRAPLGLVPDPPTGGTGSPLLDLPLVSSGDLTAEKAWILLSATLGECGDNESAATLFADVVRGQR